MKGRTLTRDEEYPLIVASNQLVVELDNGTLGFVCGRRFFSLFFLRLMRFCILSCCTSASLCS
jgi:hypothetical protein